MLKSYPRPAISIEHAHLLASPSLARGSILVALRSRSGRARKLLDVLLHPFIRLLIVLAQAFFDLIGFRLDSVGHSEARREWLSSYVWPKGALLSFGTEVLISYS
jgi:hypothetical protein